jgi:hypothetical protein
MKLKVRFSFLSILLLTFSTITFFGVAQVHATSFPLPGSACSKSSSSVSSTYVSYTCSNGFWTAKQLSYKAPSDYGKGFAIGQQLLKANSANHSDLICKVTAEGKNVQNTLIQPGSPATSTINLLNSYFGYMGCMDGIAAKQGAKAPSVISLPEPVYPKGDSLANYNVKSALHDGTSVQILQDLGGWNSTITSACGDSSGDGESQNCLSAISSFEYPGAFDENTLSTCKDSRVQANWTITSQSWIPQTLRYTPGWTVSAGADPSTGYGAEYLPSLAFSEVPFQVIVLDSYHDDVNGDFTEMNWHHFIYKDGQLFNWVSPCVSMDEAQASKYSLDIPVAPTPFKAPAGKVDKTSNAYKTMFNVGKNFAKVSMASDSANSQCSSALKTGMIKNNGLPQYLGLQARMIQSYLQTASGYQGCLDGFGH